jgi:hypothetical protein
MAEHQFLSEDEMEFFDSLPPQGMLPLLAVSGCSGRALWIGSLPTPAEDDLSSNEGGSSSESAISIMLE